MSKRANIKVSPCPYCLNDTFNLQPYGRSLTCTKCGEGTELDMIAYKAKYNEIVETWNSWCASEGAKMEKEGTFRCPRCKRASTFHFLTQGTGDKNCPSAVTIACCWCGAMPKKPLVLVTDEMLWAVIHEWTREDKK